MKKHIKKILFITFFAIFFTACSTEKEATTDIQKHKGLLQESSPDGANLEKSLLDIKAIIKTNSKQLSQVEVCNSENCWTVIENENIGPLNTTAKQKSRNFQKISSSSSLINIGNYDVTGFGEGIDRIKYIYGGLSGELQLQDKLNIDNKQKNSLYLQLDEEVRAPFSSMTINDGRNGLFIPDFDFKKEFINGVIIEIEANSSDKIAHLYISNIGTTSDENIEVNSYLIRFYRYDPNFEDVLEVKNDYPKTFSKDIDVYVPINLSNISVDELKNSYDLVVNYKSPDYEIVNLNNQNYIFFQTNETTFNVVIFNKDGAL